MNNAEIEMILQEILKEIQTLKFNLSEIETPSSEENGSMVSSQLETIIRDIGIIDSNMEVLTQCKSIEIPKIDYTPIRRFEEKLEEFKQIQRRSPPDQIVKHQHSFKNWQWLVVLFLFIGLSVLLGWYALDNYYEANDLKVKYEFVRKEMPNHIRLVDSTYQVNPNWIKDYKEPTKVIKEKQTYKKKKHH